MSDFATVIRQHAELYFKDIGWTEDEIATGEIFMGMIITSMMAFGIPVTNEKTPEMLRVLANSIELVREEAERRKKTA